MDLLATTCLFCAQPIRGDMDYDFGSVLWRCACGAVGVSAARCDFDDAGDQLLTRLAIDGRVSMPAVPVGTSGMISATPFDDRVAFAAIERAVRGAGYELRTRAYEAPIAGMEMFARRAQN